MDISTLSFAELNNLRIEIDKQIAARKRQEKMQVIDQIKALAASKGYSLDELVAEKFPSASAGTGPARKVAPKYAHPSNKALTWTGRGKQPRWVRELIEGGKSLENLAIR